MKNIIYINSDIIGNDNIELGKILMRNFLLTMVSLENTSISSIFLVNNGVKLACNDSHVLDVLKDFQNLGTKIYCCGTCLDYFNLKEQLALGEIGNMKLLCTELANNKNHIIRP